MDHSVLGADEEQEANLNLASNQAEEIASQEGKNLKIKSYKDEMFVAQQNLVHFYGRCGAELLKQMLPLGICLQRKGEIEIF